MEQKLEGTAVKQLTGKRMKLKTGRKTCQTKDRKHGAKTGRKLSKN